MLGRILSVTSINQLVIGYSTLLKQKNFGAETKDYLVINNLMLNDNSVKMIKKVAKNYNFEKIIDNRPILKKLRIGNKRNFIDTLFFYIKHKNSQKEAINQIKHEVGTTKISEIFLRYKFNTPEKLLFAAYPDSRAFIFEDGLGDYGNYNYSINKKSYWKNIKRKIKGKLKVQLFGVEYLNSFNISIKKAFHLLDIKTTSRKQKIKFNWENSIAIHKEYKNQLNILNSRFINPTITKNGILLLTSAFSCSDYWYKKKSLSVNDDIIFTKQVIKKLLKVYPKLHIYLKPHPRSKIELLEAYKKEFPDYFINEKIIIFPAEVICMNKKIKYIVSSLFSSTLLYGKYLMNKKSYYVQVPDSANPLFPPGQLNFVYKKMKEFKIHNLSDLAE